MAEIVSTGEHEFEEIVEEYEEKGGGLSTTLRLGLKCGGLESKFGRGPVPLDRSGMGLSCLCLWYKRGVCFEVPSWDTLICESSFL